MNEKEKAREILKRLKKAYPDAPQTYLTHRNVFEMLIATILSANTTDASVNKVTPTLFDRYPNAESLMNAPIEDLTQIIRSTGSYNKKSAYIKESAKILVETYGGEVPKSIAELVILPGVSRKTANVVLSVVFGINEGVVVDTHIMRVTQRLGLTNQKNREKIEKELMEMLPQKLWYKYARFIGAHGRRTCNARKPRCSNCAVNDICPSAILE
ncbi:MAG: endonuclease III [Candidatus Thorarchaeota archaeon]